MSRVGNLSSRIFVGGMDASVDELDLEKAFKIFGEITNVMVMRDRENGRSRGFAFISFKDSQSSDEAISRMHGVEIRGRCVSVRHAEKEKFVRDDKPNRGGFRGGRTPAASRSDNFRNPPPNRDNAFRGGYGMSRPPSDIVHVVRDDNELRYSRRSRSPVGGPPRYGRESPMRRMDESRGYSPPAYQSRPISPSRRHMPPMGVESDYYSDMRGAPPSQSPLRRDFSGYEESQALSPARELGAYIRARDKSPSFARPIRKLSPEPARRRSPSPTVNRSYGGNTGPRDYSLSSFQKYDNQSATQYDSRQSHAHVDRFKDSNQRSPPSSNRYRDAGRQPSSVVKYGGNNQREQPSVGRYRDADSRSEYRSQPSARREDRERFSPPHGRVGGFRQRGGENSLRGDRQSGQISRNGREGDQSSRGHRGEVSSRQQPRNVERESRDTHDFRRGSSSSSRGGFRGGNSSTSGDNYRDRSPRRESYGRREQEERGHQQPSRYRDNYEERTSSQTRRPESGDRGPPARLPRGQSPPRRRSPPPRRF